MAFAGLKKQINKANQYMTEKMGGAEGTKLDLDFMDMERKTDVTCELVEELQTKTKEFLQPNPTARAKMAAVKSISKLSGQAKSNTYPQPEGLLGDCMLMYGKKLGDDSAFGLALIEMGESLKQMADVKYSLDDSIKQNFLEPLHHLQTKDLKEVMHHRKKLEGRRLDFDCKRRRQAKATNKGQRSPYGSPARSSSITPMGSHITDDEIRQSEEKFAESLHLAQLGMFNVLENDVEQIAQLATFADALLDFHQQSTDVLKLLVESLHEMKDEAANRPKKDFAPKTLADLHIEGISMSSDGLNGAHTSQSNRSTPTFTTHLSNKPNPIHSSMPTVFLAPQNPAPRPVRVPNNTTQPSRFSNPDPFAPQNQTSWSYARPNTNQNSKPSDSDPFTPYDPWDNVFKGTSQTSSPVNKPNQLELFPGNASNQSARSANASPLPSPMKSPARTPMNRPPCCTALYDFEAENPGELGFKENDTINLINKIDENWYEGTVNGRTGYFPVSYVQVVVPLP